MSNEVLTQLPDSKNVTDIIEELNKSPKLPNLFKTRWTQILKSSGLSNKIRRQYKDEVDKVLNKGYVVYSLKAGNKDKIFISTPAEKIDNLRKIKDELANENLSPEEIEKLKERRADEMKQASAMISGAISEGKGITSDFLSGDNDKMVNAILDAFSVGIGLLSKGAGMVVAKLVELKDNKATKSARKAQETKQLEEMEKALSEEVIDKDNPETVSDEVAEKVKNEYQAKVAKSSAKEYNPDFFKATSVKELYDQSLDEAKKIYGDGFNQNIFDSVFNGEGNDDENKMELGAIKGRIASAFNKRLAMNRSQNSITNWDEAQKYAKDKLKLIHGDDYDEKIAQSMLDGLMEKYPDNPAIVVGALSRKSTNSRYSDFIPSGSKAMDAHGNEIVLIGVKDFSSDFPLVGIVYDIDGGFFYPESYNYKGQDWHAAEPKGSSEYYTMNELWKWDKSIVSKLPKISKKEFDALAYDRKLDRYFNALTQIDELRCKKNNSEIKSDDKEEEIDLNELKTEVENWKKELEGMNKNKSYVTVNSDYEDELVSVYDEFPESESEVVEVSNSKLSKYLSRITNSKNNVEFIRKCSGKCPDSGCIQQDDEGNWRVISNKTGEYWKSKYKSRESAQDALKAYHASNSRQVKLGIGDDYIGRFTIEDDGTLSKVEIKRDGELNDKFNEIKVSKLGMKPKIKDLEELVDEVSKNKKLYENIDRLTSSSISSKILDLGKDYPDWTVSENESTGEIELQRKDRKLIVDKSAGKFTLSGDEGILYRTSSEDKFIDEVKRQLNSI